MGGGMDSMVISLCALIGCTIYFMGYDGWWDEDDD